MSETLDLGGPLLLVGCGKMGGALLDGWLERGADPRSITVVEPEGGMRGQHAGQGTVIVEGPGALSGAYQPATVVFCVKPQQMDKVVPGYTRFARPETTFLSIAAGKTIAYFEARLGAAPVVRAMPNTPAAIGRGMSVLCANPRVSADQRQVCDSLLQAVGEVAWVEDEALLDAVTAVSGGGPAYVFLLIECLAEAGVAAGLPQDLALRLARVTVAGAGELVHRSDLPPSTLRENVTSPGGTTLEALKVLMADDGLQPLMTRAIAEATRRSRELAS